MFFDKLEELRKAPEEVRIHFVKLVTIIVVGIITLIWFIFTVPRFLAVSASFTTVATSTPDATATTTTPVVPLQAPFSH
ncbi:MAG: hypothetical protein KGI73_00125 [Patescibacteria group bacterium]|nr:hypothetical protein [Patescibacteria group bacterium]